MQYRNRRPRTLRKDLDKMLRDQFLMTYPSNRLNKLETLVKNLINETTQHHRDCHLHIKEAILELELYVL